MDLFYRTQPHNVSKLFCPFVDVGQTDESTDGEKAREKKQAAAPTMKLTHGQSTTTPFLGLFGSLVMTARVLISLPDFKVI